MKTNFRYLFSLIAALIALIAFVAAPVFAQQESTTLATPAESAAELPATEPVLAPQVTITDVKIGTGPEATEGASVTVHYTGWLYDAGAPRNHGRKFDSSLDRAQPITFTLGAHRVIQGWELGLSGLKVGGKRTLIIPSYLGYGAKGSNSIPPNSTLIFDVELINAR